MAKTFLSASMQSSGISFTTLTHGRRFSAHCPLFSRAASRRKFRVQSWSALGRSSDPPSLTQIKYRLQAAERWCWPYWSSRQCGMPPTTKARLRSSPRTLTWWSSYVNAGPPESTPPPQQVRSIGASSRRPNLGSSSVSPMPNAVPPATLNGALERWLCGMPIRLPVYLI